MKFRNLLITGLLLFTPNIYAAWIPIGETVPQYQNSNGDNCSGCVLKFYSSGTLTNINLATDSTGGTTATSVALDSNGYPSISSSVIIPHVEEDYKIALYPTQAAADDDSGAIWTIDTMTLATPATNEWQTSGVTPTRTSNTTFTLSGDQTSEFHVSRRLRLVDSGGTDHAAITVSSFSSPTTTITVVVDAGGVLDAGLSTVELSILSADNLAVPSTVAVTADLTGGNVLTPHEALINKYVSATTVDVDATAILLEDSSGHLLKVTSVNLTLDISTGVAKNGLGTGLTEATSTWYSLCVGDDGGTAYGWLDTSTSCANDPDSTSSYKGLVGAVFNDSGSDFDDFHQEGARVATIETNVLTGGAATSFTSVDLAATIPPIVRFIRGWLQTDDPNSASSTITVAANSGGTLGIVEHRAASSATINERAPFTMAIITSQTVWYKMGDSTENGNINITGWEW